MELAAEIKLLLAFLDDLDKAFILKQQGIILGIKLDAKTNKVHHHRRVFTDVAERQFVNRLLAERMLGMNQQVTNMLPVLKRIMFPLLKAMQRTHDGGLTPVTQLLQSTAYKWLIYTTISWNGA